MRGAFAWALLFFAAACGGDQTKANLSYRPRDAFGEVAAKAAEKPCGAATAGLPPVPRAPAGEFAADVVFYFAHPEDETLFTPGTIDALVKAKKRVFAVYLSHGEGGRLLERTQDGQVKEKAGVPPLQVAKVRDREIARVAKLLGIEYTHLYPATATADFITKDVEGLARAIHSCTETYERWHELLPDGLGGLMKLLVEDIRARKPRIIVTHDARDDEDFLDHGHHKALGALVEVAARAAADFKLSGGGPPHAIEELVTIAPKQESADVTLILGNDVRKKLIAEHASQFDAQKFADVGMRTTERYVVKWRSQGAPPVTGGSRLASYVHP